MTVSAKDEHMDRSIYLMYIMLNLLLNVCSFMHSLIILPADKFAVKSSTLSVDIRNTIWP